MAFLYLSLGKSGLLELPIDIAGEHETALYQPITDVAQNLEATMRQCRAVQGEAMAVKPPGQFRRIPKSIGTGDILKLHFRLRQARIGFPKPLRSPEIGEPGIDAHAGTGRDQKAIGLLNQRDGMGNRVSRHGSYLSRRKTANR